MNIYSGKYKVLESGTIIPDKGNSIICIQIEPQKEFPINIVLSFEENGGQRDLNKTVDNETNEIKFECLNFGKGAGTIEPLSLASINEKEIFLHVWTEMLSSKNNIRRVDYTVFIER